MLTIENIVVVLSIIGIVAAMAGAYIIRKGSFSSNTENGATTSSDQNESKIKRNPNSESNIRLIYLKLSCYLTGYDFKIVKEFDPWSKRKIIILAISILYPTLAWMSIGYFWSVNIVGIDVIAGLSIGLSIGFIILFLERVAVLSVGSKSINILHTFIFLLAAVLGSIVVNQTVFKKDVEYKLSQQRTRRERLLLNQIKTDQGFKEDSARLGLYMKEYDAFSSRALAELDGKFSSKPGYGVLTKYYLNQRDSLFKLTIAPQQKRVAKKDSLVRNDFKRLKVEAEANEGLLTRLNANFSVIFNSTAGITFFVIFFVLIGSLEFFGVILRYGLRPSSFEKDEPSIISNKA